MFIGQARGHAPAGCAVKKADLNQEWFVDFFQRIRLFRQRSGQGIQAHRAAVVLLNNGEQKPAVNLVESGINNSIDTVRNAYNFWSNAYSNLGR